MRDIGGWFGLERVAQAVRRIDVLGCPFDGAATGPVGSAAGPAAIRAWSETQEAIDEHGVPITGVRVIDHGDVSAEPGGALGTIRQRARAVLDERPDVLLGLGGDHAVTMPLAGAVAERNPGLAFVMLDAHADCFPDYDGDPDSHACTVARLWDRGDLAPARTALIGLRSYATPELPALERAGLVITASEWASNGSAWVALSLREFLGDSATYVSLDIDVLDPAYAPGTGYPVPGGPSTRDLLDLIHGLVPHTSLKGVDIVEVAPGLEGADITAAAAAQVALQLFAAIAAGARGGSGGE